MEVSRDLGPKGKFQASWAKRDDSKYHKGDHALYRRLLPLKLDMGGNILFCALGMGLGPWLERKLREFYPKIILLR